MSQTEAMDISPDKCIGEKSETESKKLCADCKTAKTPLWRTGPHGPKSLCNACGIRFRKKKAGGGGGGADMGLNKESSGKKKEKASSPASSSISGVVMGLDKQSPDKKKEKPSPASSSCSTTTTTTAAIATTDCSGKKGNDGGKTSEIKGKDGKLKVRLMGLGKEMVLLKRPRSPMKRARSGKKLGEVEQAALLLMAISCGSVYA